jgi:hypothetical protein
VYQNLPTEVAIEVENAVEKLVAGKIDCASARCDLMVALRARGFWDLSCDEDWLNGVLDLNSALRSLWWQYSDGLRPPVLAHWPAQEFYRAFPRPAQRDWISRWTDVGGRVYSGKMIALKDDPVWCALSDFGFPFPPFAPGSGMRVRGIDRDVVTELGLIDGNRQVSPRKVSRPKLIFLERTPKRPDAATNRI